MRGIVSASLSLCNSTYYVDTLGLGAMDGGIVEGLVGFISRGGSSPLSRTRRKSSRIKHF